MPSNKTNIFLNICKIYRINSWYYYLGFVLIGLAITSPINLQLFKYIMLSSFLLAYAFSINDFYDECQKRFYFIFPFILLFIFLPFFNMAQIIISIFFILIVTLYSVPQVRLKTIPFISSLCNGLGFSMIFLVGYLNIPYFDLKGVLFMFYLFSFEMIAQLIHEIVHFNEDKKNNFITTAVFLGKTRTKKFCYIFLFLALLAIVYLFFMRIIGMLFLITSVLFIMYFVIEIKSKRINLKLREKYRKFGIVTGIIYILLILLRKYNI